MKGPLFKIQKCKNVLRIFHIFGHFSHFWPFFIQNQRCDFLVHVRLSTIIRYDLKFIGPVKNMKNVKYFLHTFCYFLEKTCVSKKWATILKSHLLHFVLLCSFCTKKYLKWERGSLANLEGHLKAKNRSKFWHVKFAYPKRIKTFIRGVSKGRFWHFWHLDTFLTPQNVIFALFWPKNAKNVIFCYIQDCRHYFSWNFHEKMVKTWNLLIFAYFWPFWHFSDPFL